MEKNKFVLQEEAILKFWQDAQIFEKSLKKDAPKGDYVFYDGPPFATGTPHYGHIVASLMKDTVPRYFTMQGYHVPRRWGWDCHGLPIENIVEKELNLNSKKDIEEEIGVEKFNAACREKVYTYVQEWKKFIPRIGRFVDMENPYSTMDLDFMNKIWWVFKQLWDKGYIYEGHKSMHICPRCETTLSQSEVSQGYKEVKDISITAKFALVDEPDTFVLAWTTTPWTLPGNVALAVGKDIEYVKVEIDHKFYILAQAALERVLQDKSYKITAKLKGAELVGKSYEPLFPYFATAENKMRGFKIYAADFVAIEEGTGVVHIAPAFGADDLALGKKESLPWVQHVDFSGKFTPAVSDFAGRIVKSKEDPQAIDIEILKYLSAAGKVFAKEKYNHTYPHCWRCDSPLLNYSTSSWFVNVTKLKPRMLELAKQIYWMPEHVKAGRFGKWLEGAQDWSISRQRFWGSVLPIWSCAQCKEKKVFGSKEELEQLTGGTFTDLHKDKMDKIVLTCGCGGQMHRIPDVLDCWFESGSMPYQESKYPADFIAEGVDQTRCWFYYLLVLGAAVKEEIPFKNVIANGIVLAEDGQKMSKRLKNYPDPQLVVDKYGADALRYYLLTSPVMKADTLNFSEKGVDEVFKKLIMILGNTVSFYEMYAQKDTQANTDSTNVLDKWIMAKLQILIKAVTVAMEQYDLVQASRPLIEFTDELSTWYLRRSRERFKALDAEALNTMKYVLAQFSRVLGPFTPFIAETIYQKVDQSKESVHLESWPVSDDKLIGEEVITGMQQVRQDVEKALALRDAAQIKIRQPLAKLYLAGSKLSTELTALIADEVNVKEVIFGKEDKLDTALTPELVQEGLFRELVRAINGLRKEQKLTIQDQVELVYETADPDLRSVFEKYSQELSKSVLAKTISSGTGEHELKINQKILKISLSK